MPYCPKCGIETDYYVKECPLCNFNIPLIEPNEKERELVKEASLKFPEPENFNPGYLIDLKRKTFWAVSLFLLLNVVVLAGIQLAALKLIPSLMLISLFLISIWFYFMVFFGIVANRKLMILVLILNSFFFMLLVDRFFNGISWFFPVFVPSIILGSIILIITTILIRYKKKRSFGIIFNISVAISGFVIGVEAIISNYLKNKIILSRSLLISGELIVFSLLLLFFYCKIPSRMKEAIKKKMHI